MTKGYAVGLALVLVVAAFVIWKPSDKTRVPPSAGATSAETVAPPETTSISVAPESLTPTTVPQEGSIVGQDVSDSDFPPPRKLTAYHSFEIRQISFLQTLTKANLDLEPEQVLAVDKVFADFVRRTAEDRPRPVFLAYSATKAVDSSGQVIPGMKPAGMTIDSDPAAAQVSIPDSPQVLADKEGNPLYLVQLIIDELRPEQEAPFRAIVGRWNVLRPRPVDGPLRRLRRAIRDPQVGLSEAERTVAVNALTSFRTTLSRAERKRVPPEASEKALAVVLETLAPQQAARLQATLAVLEAHQEEWSTGARVQRAYADAVRLLEGGG